jgi:hypothetical protein
VTERAMMWQNFLWACKLGTVIQDHTSTVWQKRGKDMWQRVGASSDYSAESIAWPVDVLLEGIE